MSIKAILFDMDGVLIEAKDWHYEALNEALRLFGYEISRYDHLNVFDGLPTRNKLKMLSLEKNLPEELHDFINEMKQQYTMDMVYTQCKPRFVHEYALSKLKADGYQIAVCTNSIRSTLETMMEKAKLTKYIDAMFSNEDVSKGKPDPEIYQSAMKHFGLKPEETLIVEDNFNGIKAAKASGGNLMVVKEVSETNYQNITNSIQKISFENEGIEHGH
ncbi:MAG: HAD family phosphatase [Rhizobiales bacterium]|nr:HAD family phosphatase [Hyphomicrobiales bacterium]